MSRKTFLFVGIFLILLSALLFLREKVFVGEAELLIQTDPEATVFIDGEQVGTTPYQAKIKPREIEVKLIPFVDGGSGLAIYEIKIKLAENVQTAIRHTFGPTEETSSGFLVYFQKIGGRNAALTVVSSPEGAELSLDDRVVDTTPHKVEATRAGDHPIRVFAPGYSEREFSVKTEPGYELTAFVKLAKLPEEENPQEPVAPAPQEKRVIVEILPTPTGFLRVRNDSGTGAPEIARVTPGKKYTFIEEKTVGGTTWYKLEYEKDKSGWVSGQYAKKVEENL